MLQDALSRGATTLPEAMVKKAIIVAAPLSQVGFSFSRDVVMASAKTADFAYRNLLKPALSVVLPIQFFSDSVVEDHTRFTQTRCKAVHLVKGHRRQHKRQPLASQLRRLHNRLGSGAQAFSMEAEASTTTAVHNLASSVAAVDSPQGFKVALGFQASML